MLHKCSYLCVFWTVGRGIFWGICGASLCTHSSTSGLCAYVYIRSIGRGILRAYSGSHFNADVLYVCVYSGSIGRGHYFGHISGIFVYALLHWCSVRMCLYWEHRKRALFLAYFRQFCAPIATLMFCMYVYIRNIGRGHYFRHFCAHIVAPMVCMYVYIRNIGKGIYWGIFWSIFRHTATPIVFMYCIYICKYFLYFLSISDITAGPRGEKCSACPCHRKGLSSGWSAYPRHERAKAWGMEKIFNLAYFV